MPRELRRLLIDPQRFSVSERDQGGVCQPIRLNHAEIHYLGKVLRLRCGDRLSVIDGCGQLWSAVLRATDRLELEQPVEQPLQRQSARTPSLCLAMAVPKRDADLVWRMATELGADHLQPLLAQRSAVRGRLPLERWQVIAREATEQCERLWLPKFHQEAMALKMLGSPLSGWGLLATTRRPNLPLLEQVLDQWKHEGVWPASEVTLAIGPEGGWTDQEEAAAMAAGWRAVGLGEAILRSSTAAVAGLAQLIGWRHLSCGPSLWPCL